MGFLCKLLKIIVNSIYRRSSAVAERLHDALCHWLLHSVSQ